MKKKLKKVGIKGKLNKTNILKKEIIIALEKSLGIVTTACKQVGISRITYYEWLKTDENFRKEVEGLNEVANDFVETKLYQLINELNPAATIFYAKTKMKHRGYIETVEIKQHENNKINITVSKPENLDVLESFLKKE